MRAQVVDDLTEMIVTYCTTYRYSPRSIVDLGKAHTADEFDAARDRAIERLGWTSLHPCLADMQAIDLRPAVFYYAATLLREGLTLDDVAQRLNLTDDQRGYVSHYTDNHTGQQTLL
jgi:hypothetical protein